MSEKSLEEEIKIKAQKAKKLARYMSSTQDLVEDQILKAQARGDFNNLEGAGKPVNLYENPYEPPELRMTFKILKDNDFAPHWIELGKDIDAEIQKFWQGVEYFKRYTHLFVNDKHSKISWKRFAQRKAHFYFESRLSLEKIDKKIRDYNLHCPTYELGRAQLNIDNEMFKVISGIEEIIEAMGNSET